ncbi:hypothetical protein BH11PSE5_BH11PSE5_05640 [soil metagenome]
MDSRFCGNDEGWRVAAAPIRLTHYPVLHPTCSAKPPSVPNLTHCTEVHAALPFRPWGRTAER